MLTNDYPHQIDKFESGFDMYAQIVAASGKHDINIYKIMMEDPSEKQNPEQNIGFVREDVENVLHNREKTE